MRLPIRVVHFVNVQNTTNVISGEINLLHVDTGIGKRSTREEIPEMFRGIVIYLIGGRG
jgi:hypothetical protein